MKVFGGVVALLAVGVMAAACLWSSAAMAEVDGYYILAASGEIQHLGSAPFFGDFVSPARMCQDLELYPNSAGDVIGYLMLLGDGTVNVFGAAPTLPSGSWPFFGWDIARDLASFPDELGRGPFGVAGFYLLDGFGGQFVVSSGSPVPPNFKPYRDRQSPDNYVYFGWDIAKQLEVSARFIPGVNPGDDPIPVANGYYILDGYGAFHWCLEDPSGNVIPGPWFGEPLAYFGWDIARAAQLTPSAQGVYLLDGYGGIHMYGDANRSFGPAVPYFGTDIARDIEIVENESGVVTGLYVMTGDGAVYGEGNATIFPGGHLYWNGSTPDVDAARDLEVTPVFRFISSAVVTGP